MKFERDVAALQQMTGELQDYLLSDVMFWQLGGSSDFPKLSLGTYLLIRARLSARPSDPAVQALNQAGDAVLVQWSVTAERKAAAELHMRVDLWQAFLDEGQAHYATEVTQRAIAALLIRRFPHLAETADARRLAVLDERVKTRFPEGTFVWDAALQPAFPRDDFWFLYRAA
jgi:hypothetical protein